MRKPRLRTRRRRAAILGVLAEHGPLPATEICNRLGWWGSVWALLEGLETEGAVTSDRALMPDGTRRRYWRLADR